MKKVYIKPNAEIIKLNLINSVLEEAPVNNGSKESEWGDAAAKKDTWYDEDESEASSNTNMWDE